MDAEDFHVTCPACRRDHLAPAFFPRGEPHYCSLACFYEGKGINGPGGGHVRRLCPGCMRYFERESGSMYCSDACKLSHWKRRQPDRSQTTAARAADLGQVIGARAPAPYLADDSARVLDEATASLGTLRRLAWVGDAGAMLHLLGSLAEEIEAQLGETIREAREQDYSWNEITALLGASRERAKRLAAGASRGSHAVALTTAGTAPGGDCSDGEITSRNDGVTMTWESEGQAGPLGEPSLVPEMAHEERGSRDR